MNYVWQKKDLEFIQKNYPYSISMKDIAEKYGTSVSAVGRIVTKLGCDKCPIDLRNKRSGKSRLIWTEKK